MALDNFLFFTALIVLLISMSNGQDWIVLPMVGLLIVSEHSLGMIALTLGVTGLMFLLRSVFGSGWSVYGLALIILLSLVYARQQPPQQELPPEYYMPQGYGGMEGLGGYGGMGGH